MAEDWKAALAALRGDAAGEPVSTDNDAAEPVSTGVDGAVSSGKRRILKMFYEKKGRAGKPATILEGFDPDDDTEALDVARRLKQRLGCGGSARGGEILLQGDRRQQAAQLLRDMGYQVKG